jgi:MFS family permease
MVADILPEEKRSEGFGMMRVVANLSWIIGPTIGGLVAARSFFALFVIDAVMSSIVAVIFFKLIPESMPQHLADAPKESIGKTMKGYLTVLGDRPFLAFLAVSMLVLLVYGQLYNTLSVYMRDMHGFSAQQYGLVLSASAVTVVLTQLWVSSRTRSRSPFLMMALGTLFYMVGFTMFGVVQPYALFIAAVVVVTIGEMIAMPVSQTLAAKFAPEAMRGRYMGAFSLVWALPAAVGPGAAGVIMDNLNPNLVWLGGGVILAVAALGYYGLHLALSKQVRFQAQAEGEAEFQSTD